MTKRLVADYETGDLVTVCSWCNRVEIDGEWFLLPRTARAAIDEAAITHSICPECEAAQRRSDRA